MREAVKSFIVAKVRKAVSPDQPYFFVRWSGLYELCKAYGLDLLELIDELHSEGKLRKAIIKGKLAITTPELAMASTRKAKAIIEEFHQFMSKEVSN